MCFSPYLGVGGGGGGSQAGWGTTCLSSFTASAAQNWSSLSPLRGALLKAIEFGPTGGGGRLLAHRRRGVSVCAAWGGGAPCVCVCVCLYSRLAPLRVTCGHGEGMPGPRAAAPPPPKCNAPAPQVCTVPWTPDPTGFEVVINGTALGMREDDPIPVDAAKLTEGQLVCEVVMTPADTPLLRMAKVLPPLPPTSRPTSETQRAKRATFARACAHTHTVLLIYAGRVDDVLGGGGGAHATREAHATRNQQGARPAHVRPTELGTVGGGRPGQRVEEQGTWASRTRKRSEAGYGRPVDRGAWTAQTVKRPPQPPIRQLLGAADVQTAHPATSSTAPAHQLLCPAHAETTPAGAPAAAADRTQRPDATCEGKSGCLSRAPYRTNDQTDCHTRGGLWPRGSCDRPVHRGRSGPDKSDASPPGPHRDPQERVVKHHFLPRYATQKEQRVVGHRCDPDITSAPPPPPKPPPPVGPLAVPVTGALKLRGVWERGFNDPPPPPHTQTPTLAPFQKGGYHCLCL